MSHGDLGTIRGSDLKNFEIDKIYERLNTKNCPALMNKPKVIIIQACRGGDYQLAWHAPKRCWTLLLHMFLLLLLLPVIVVVVMLWNILFSLSHLGQCLFLKKQENHEQN